LQEVQLDGQKIKENGIFFQSFAVRNVIQCRILQKMQKLTDPVAKSASKFLMPQQDVL
jgi:hypothetical protein